MIASLSRLGLCCLAFVQAIAPASGSEPSPTLSVCPVHWVCRAFAPPPPEELTAFLTEGMRTWLDGALHSIVDELRQFPDVQNVACTYEPDQAIADLNVEILKSSSRKEVDEAALQLLRKALRFEAMPDRSLDGTDIIIRFDNYRIASIEVWNGHGWVPFVH